VLVSYKVEKTVYFDNPGFRNTDMVLNLSKDRALALGIKDIVVATNSGATGVKASEMFKGLNLVAVTHYFRLARRELKEENRKIIEKNGGKILTCSQLFGGIERGIRMLYETILPLDLIENTLKIFGDGMKVAIEISMMAADAGLIPTDREVISIAGTWRGADTAIVIQPQYSTEFYFLEVREIIAKPRITLGSDERVFFEGSMEAMRKKVLEIRRKKGEMMSKNKK
jgi:hypothetical protein